jgi:hypothetical protein
MVSTTKRRYKMSVWVVTEGNCTCCSWYVGGVFSTEEKANEYIATVCDSQYTDVSEAVIEEV